MHPPACYRKALGREQSIQLLHVFISYHILLAGVFITHWARLRVVCSVTRQCHENAGVPALTASAPTRHHQCSETPGNRWLVVVPAATAAGIWCTQNPVRGWLLGFFSACSCIWRYLQVSPPPPGAFEPGLCAAVYSVASFSICRWVTLSSFHLALCVLIYYL